MGCQLWKSVCALIQTSQWSASDPVPSHRYSVKTVESGRKFEAEGRDTEDRGGGRE